MEVTKPQAMYSPRDSFRKQAIEYVKQAVHEDNAGNYARAFPLYMNALEYFKAYLKYEVDPKIKEAVMRKFDEYILRAEQVRALLDAACSGSARSAPTTTTTEHDDGRSDEETLKDALKSAVVMGKPNVKWADVAGLDRAKQALQAAVILPVKFPHLFNGKRRPWRAFLLYGPPGTGKLYLAKAVATEASSTFFSVSASDLVSKWMGQSEKLISNLFRMAKESAPSIVFIHEIESLLGHTTRGDDADALRRARAQLLAQMQEAEQNDEKVFVIAATNSPYGLDQAILRRRFDKRIHIPLPGFDARLHLFKWYVQVHLGDMPHNLTDSDYESLARTTEGLSGSDISNYILQAIFSFKTKDDEPAVACGPSQPDDIQTTVKELCLEYLASKIVPRIAKSHFDDVLSRKRPAIRKSDMEMYERFTREFGEEG